MTESAVFGVFASLDGEGSMEDSVAVELTIGGASVKPFFHEVYNLKIDEADYLDN